MTDKRAVGDFKIIIPAAEVNGVDRGILVDIDLVVGIRIAEIEVSGDEDAVRIFIADILAGNKCLRSVGECDLISAGNGRYGLQCGPVTDTAAGDRAVEVDFVGFRFSGDGGDRTAVDADHVAGTVFQNNGSGNGSVFLNGEFVCAGSEFDVGGDFCRLFHINFIVAFAHADNAVEFDVFLNMEGVVARTRVDAAGDFRAFVQSDKVIAARGAESALEVSGDVDFVIRAGKNDAFFLFAVECGVCSFVRDGDGSVIADLDPFAFALGVDLPFIGGVVDEFVGVFAESFAFVIGHGDPVGAEIRILLEVFALDEHNIDGVFRCDLDGDVCVLDFFVPGQHGAGMALFHNEDVLGAFHGLVLALGEDDVRGAADRDGVERLDGTFEFTGIVIENEFGSAGDITFLSGSVNGAGEVVVESAVAGERDGGFSEDVGVFAARVDFGDFSVGAGGDVDVDVAVYIGAVAAAVNRGDFSAVVVDGDVTIGNSAIARAAAEYGFDADDVVQIDCRAAVDDGGADIAAIGDFAFCIKDEGAAIDVAGDLDC